MTLLSTELLQATPEELAKEAELSLWRIGHAYLRYAGVGGVHGVVTLTTDPNDRYNPRALDQAHVDSLARTFAKVGGKQDRETPIYLKCKESLIDPSCLHAMKGDRDRPVSSRDLDFAPPPLRLVRTQAKEEDRLEQEIWFKRDHNTNEYLSEVEVSLKKVELDRLRSGRDRATLVNGNHRTESMLAVSRSLNEERDAIVALDQAGELGPEDLTLRLESLRKLVAGATYRCEVYKGAD